MVRIHLAKTRGLLEIFFVFKIHLVIAKLPFGTAK